MRHKMIASWPGPDPAIHVYHRPPDVYHRVKPGDDDLRVSEERGRCPQLTTDPNCSIRAYR